MTVCRQALSIIRTAGRMVSSPARRWCVGGATIAVLAALFVSHADLTRMGRSFLRADWHWLAVALGLMLVSLLLRSVALKVIVDALGCVRTRLSETFSATSIGLLATPVIPIRVGTVLAPYTLYVLLRRRGATIPFATTLGMALTEQLFAIASFVALSLLFVSALSLPRWAVQVLIASAAGLASLSLQDLTLTDLRGKSREAASLPHRDDGPAPSRAKRPARL